MLATRFVRCLAAGVVSLAAISAMHSERTATNEGASGKANLQNSVPARAAAADDMGEVDGAQIFPSLTLHFAMTPSKQTALQRLLIEQQDPASPQYHHWLTPEQFRIRFGMDRNDENAVMGWLSSQGFTVTEVSRGGLFLRFSGTAAQVKQAFGATAHSISINGEPHMANLATLSVPTAFSAVIAGVSGLDDFHPRPHGHVRMMEDGPTPAYSTPAGAHYLAPGDFNTIYGGSPLPSGVTGSGVTIAVAGQSDIELSDIAAFQTAAGLAVKAPTVNTYGVDPGTPSIADFNEAEMDIEWAGAVAPGASILYVNSNDAIAGSLTEAIDYDLAPIVETSYGTCEANAGINAIAYMQLLFEMANAEGITIVGAAGDSGATDCDVNVGSAVNGLAVDFPASSPNVTAVGGTEFNEGTGTYWTSTNTGTLSSSATGYIPEDVWNDDNTAGLSATGGGASAYFSKPSWQIGTGVPNDFARDVPDVALAASINHDGYLICTGSSNCTSGFTNASGGYVVSGGTSAASAAFAGLLALVEQKTGAPLGNANQAIYALANSSFATNVFHDITTGTNASSCTSGSVNCGNGGTIGFAAGAGYDQATGWGSVNISNLVSDWSQVTPLVVTGGQNPSVTNLSGTLTSAIAGTPIAFTISVASATTQTTATPTGTAQMAVDGTAVGAAVMLSNGNGGYQLDTTSLSAGTHTVQATYSGDSTYAGSRAAFVITITAAGGPDFSLTPSTANVTVKSGDLATPVTFTVTSLGGFNGSVAFTASVPTPLAAMSSFTLNPVNVSVSPSDGATSQFQLLAYAYSSKLELPLSLPIWQRGGAGVLFAFVVMCVFPRRRKFPWLAVLLAVGVLSMTGCGPANEPSITTKQPTTIGTPAGTYSVLIQAIATINGAQTEHTATITYVVQ